MYFDKDSGLITQREGMQQGMVTVTKISDYKEIDGVKIAHRNESSGGQMNPIITFSSVEHNVDIDDAKFELPAAIKELVPSE